MVVLVVVVVIVVVIIVDRDTIIAFSLVIYVLQYFLPSFLLSLNKHI